MKLGGLVTSVVALMALLLAGGLLPACSSGSAAGQTSLQPAPDFQLADLQGQTVTLSSLRGKVVVLNFWSTT